MSLSGGLGACQSRPMFDSSRSVAGDGANSHHFVPNPRRKPAVRGPATMASLSDELVRNHHIASPDSMATPPTLDIADLLTPVSEEQPAGQELRQASDRSVARIYFSVR